MQKQSPKFLSNLTLPGQLRGGAVTRVKIRLDTSHAVLIVTVTYSQTSNGYIHTVT